MKFAYVACVATALALSSLACSAEGPSTRERLVGLWGSDASDNPWLSYGFTKEGFVTRFLLDMTDEAPQLQEDIGAFEVRDGMNGSAAADGSYLFLQTDISSCDGSHVARTAGFWVWFVGDSLRLEDANRTLSFHRIADGDLGGADPRLTTLGCFTEAGFVPGEPSAL